MDASRLALINASTELAGHVTAFESRMAGITENAKAQAVKHIARRTDEIARGSTEVQTRAMEEAARGLFRAEVGPALQRLVTPLQHLADRGARSLGALVDACGDGFGGLCPHLDAGGLAVGAVAGVAGELSNPSGLQW